MRSQFVIINAIILSIVLVAWHLGIFDSFPDLQKKELIMLGGLFVYSLGGFIAVCRKCWATARHIANGIPMWALGCTGLGMLLAVHNMHSVNSAALTSVFRNLAFSISPNIVGVMLMAWLRELIWWLGHEES